METAKCCHMMAGQPEYSCVTVDRGSAFFCCPANADVSRQRPGTGSGSWPDTASRFGGLVLGKNPVYKISIVVAFVFIRVATVQTSRVVCDDLDMYIGELPADTLASHHSILSFYT